MDDEVFTFSTVQTYLLNTIEAFGQTWIEEEMCHCFHIFPFCLLCSKGTAQRLKRLPTMRETWVRSLGREDPLEKEMATHTSVLAWRIPQTEEPGGLQSTGSQRVGHD